MNFNKTLLAVALAGASVTAHAVPTVMTVTDGWFKMGVFTPGVNGLHWVAGTGGADITDQFLPASWNVNVGQTNGVSAPGAIASFQFGTNPGSQVNTFTAAADTQGVDAGGHAMPVFSGAFVNGAQTFDISSMYANWNGTNFNQGSSAATLTLSNCTGTSCDYSMTWSSLIVGGAFNGNTGKWIMNGTIAAVPEASTYGMMLAGLGLVGFAARRRTRRVA